jgi:outer membrane protein TolC
MVFCNAAQAACRRAAPAVLAIAAGLAVTLTTPALAVDAPLTLPEARRLAVARSHQIVAQDHAAVAAREMGAAAGQLPDPVLQFGVDNLPVDGADRFSLTRDFMTMRKIGVMQEFTRAEKRDARAERFEREAEKVSAERTVAIASIQRDATLAWLDRYYAERQAAVLAEQRDQARAEIEAAEGAYRGGRGNLADVLAARAALGGLDDRASEIGRRIRNAKTALTRWVGTAADAPLGARPAIETIRLDPALSDDELAHHPQIAVLLKEEEMAVAESRVARAGKSADWSVEVSYSQRGPAYSNMISLTVSVPLQWDQAHRQDRELAAKLALVEQVRAQREDALRAHVAEVRAMIAEWENDGERVARYQRELLPLAAERTQATLAAYRGGKSGITDVLVARRNEIDVRLQALQLEMDAARLWAQLDFLVPEGDANPGVLTPNKDLQ